MQTLSTAASHIRVRHCRRSPEVCIIRGLLGLFAVGKTREGWIESLGIILLEKVGIMEIIFVKAVKNQRIGLILRLKAFVKSI